MEYLVKINEKARILELKRTHLKITVMTSNTPYPSRKILRICAYTLLKTTKDLGSIRPIQAQLNNLRREIKKVNENVYAAQVGCEQCKGPTTPKIVHSMKKGKPSKKLTTLNFGAPFQGGEYKETALGFYQRNNANPSYQEQRQAMEDTLSKFMNESAKKHEENSNLIKEIRAPTDAEGASIKTLDTQIEQMSKAL
nr:hypothetical protein [Tanacetum cinerariifolium]